MLKSINSLNFDSSQLQLQSKDISTLLVKYKVLNSLIGFRNFRFLPKVKAHFSSRSKSYDHNKTEIVNKLSFSMMLFGKVYYSQKQQQLKKFSQLYFQVNCVSSNEQSRNGVLRVMKMVGCYLLFLHSEQVIDFYYNKRQLSYKIILCTLKNFMVKSSSL